eukprot:TRINITY_DN1485_c0_g1_i1.p1 TRINITY_DN1485_c0_g1~~TRINITY_DN1485_c0_g1_i1.p1  ORF type:complete len:1406 (+),score=209.07 TRINITY_DN1485_c0_g1_i1:1668-5885(+)
MGKSTSKSTKRLGRISSKSTLKKPSTSSKSTKTKGKSSSKSTKKLGRVSSKSTLKKGINEKSRKSYKPMKLTFKFNKSVYSKLPGASSSLKSSVKFPNVMIKSGFSQPKLSQQTNSVAQSSAQNTDNNDNKQVTKQSTHHNIKSTLNTQQNSESSANTQNKTPTIDKQTTTTTESAIPAVASTSTTIDSSVKQLKDTQQATTTESTNNNNIKSSINTQQNTESSVNSVNNAPTISQQTTTQQSTPTAASTSKPIDSSLKPQKVSTTTSKSSTNSQKISPKSKSAQTISIKPKTGTKTSTKTNSSPSKYSSKTNLQSLIQEQLQLSLSEGPRFPSYQRSNGRLVISTDNEKYSEKYYNYLSVIEITISNYEILIKRIFELKISTYLYTEKLKKAAIFSTSEQLVVKSKIAIMQKELKIKKAQELKLRAKIQSLITSLQEEKLISLENFLKKKLSKKLHALMSQFSNLKSQYTLILIRMKIITESKHSITLRIRTLFSEIASNKLSAIELKIRYFELLLLNSQNLQLDQESLLINKNKGKIFSLIQKLIKQINQEEALDLEEKEDTSTEIVDVIGDMSAKGKGKFIRSITTTTPIERKTPQQTKSQEELDLEKEILSLTGNSLSLLQKLYKLIKITSMLKKQLTILAQYQFSTKQEIQKLTIEQFSIKMQLGIAKVEWDVYAEKIRRLRVEYEKAKSKKNIVLMNQIATKINSAVKQLEIPKAKAWDLQSEYDQLQQKIDDYLKRLNTITEKIIIYKKQLIQYEMQQRKLEELQLIVERRSNKEKKIQQNKIKQTLKTQKQETQELREQITTKTKERDIACTQPKSLPKKKQDKTWLNNDYGWGKFIKIRIIAYKKNRYVPSIPSKKIPYTKTAFDDGVFRIRSKLTQILLFEIQREAQIGGDLFKRMKVQIDNYVKVLVKQESVLQSNEVVITQRMININQKEITVKKNAESITDDISKCKLGFAKIRKEAELIRGKGKTVLQTIQTNVHKLEKQLSVIQKKNSEEEKELKEKEKKIKEKLKEIEQRKQKINELKKLQLSQATKIIQKEKVPEVIKVNADKIKTSDVVLTKSTTKQQQYSLSLEGQEQALDKQVNELESKSDKYEDVSKSIDEETIIIESNLQKLITEEQKIINEKKQLTLKREKLESQIQKCRLDFTKSSTKLITLREKKFKEMCLLNKDKFRQEKHQLDHQIEACNQLQNQLKDEKHQYQNYQKKLISYPRATNKSHKKPDLSVSSLLQKSMIVKPSPNNNPEYQKLFTEVKTNVAREHLQRNINSALNFLNNLAEDNAKEAYIISEKLKEKSVMLEGVKLVQKLTRKITSKLNLILSEYPEDSVKLKSMLKSTMLEIDKLYEMTKNQSEIMQSAQILQEKEKKLQNMQEKCMLQAKANPLGIQSKLKKGFMSK